MAEARQATTAQHAIGEADLPPGTADLALVPVEERNLRGLELAEEMFTLDHRRQVAELLMVPAESPALLPYLALCIAEGFSPWANHVWLIPKKVKVPSQDGEGTTEVVKHIPAVGRDGLLHKARQSLRSPGGFRGLRYNVVCERDTFEVEDDGLDVKILHRFASKPTEFAPEEAPDRWRGRVLGAWAKVFIEGRPSEFYFANLREHGRLQHVWAYDEGARRRRPLFFDEEGRQGFEEFGPAGRRRPVQEWAGAWDYLSTMILKAAQSYVLRIAFGVTGFLPVDEMRDLKAWQEEAAESAMGASGGADLGAQDFDFDALDVPDELRDRLRHAVDVANSQQPFSWGPAKCEMVFSGRTADELAGVVEDIERENDLREQRIARAASEPEEVTDAEVVEEQPPPPAEADPAKIEQLRHELADLVAAKDSAEGDELTRVTARIEGVATELRGLGVDPRDLL